MNANAYWFPGQIWWTISPLLTGRAVCQWVRQCSWNLFDMIVEHGHLKTHIESVQAKVKYPCNLCEHKAITQGILKNHNESVHENVQYTCNLCKYKAKQCLRIIKPCRESKWSIRVYFLLNSILQLLRLFKTIKIILVKEKHIIIIIPMLRR